MDLPSIYFIVLGVYALVYLAVFVAPLLASAFDLRPGDSLDRLDVLLEAEAEEAAEARAHVFAALGDGAVATAAPEAPGARDSGPPPLPAATAGKPIPDEHVADEDRLTVGAAFATWCGDAGLATSELTRFASHLGDAVPGATVRALYRDRDSPRRPVVFSDDGGRSPAEYWVVEGAGGPWLLPFPQGPRQFRDLAEGVFDGERVAPQNLSQAIPARLRPAAAGGYVVQDAGTLRGGPYGASEEAPASNWPLADDADDRVEEEEEEEEAYVAERPETPRTAQTLAMERLTHHRALTARYPSRLVQDAVDRVRVQYPAGQYQRVEVDQLPTYLVYAERMNAARTMAGLFVLLGLVLTMTKLNGVVGEIAQVTEASADQAQFLDFMGRLMDGIGGAFTASIWGLWLMLAALGALALVDLVVQRYVARVDRAFAGRVVPALASLHQALNPDLSLGDLLAKTGTSLRGLNVTVSDLTNGMGRSLDALGERIEDMLEDFGRFESHYIKLDGLLQSIDKAGHDLQKVTGGLEGASRRLADPLDDFNRHVREHLEQVRTHLETVGEATAANIEGYRETSEHLLAIQAHSDATVQAIENLVATRVDGSAERHTKALEAFQAQGKATQKEMARLVAALEKGAARAVPAATGPGTALGRPAETADLPPTLFLWVAGGLRRVVRALRARFGGR